MSGASVIFYGRRSRSNRTFDDVGFGAASSSSPSSTPSSSSDRGISQHHRHRRRDHHRRDRHIHHLDDADNFRRSSHARLPLVASEPHQQGSVGDCPPRNIVNGETVQGLNRRFSVNGRLPTSVLLAKERLLQRLRGVSVSGSSSGGETETLSSGNDFREVDAGWATSDSREQPPIYSITELLHGVLQRSAMQKPNKKLPGLTEETLSQLHHEIYHEHPEGMSDSTSGGSNECSICLENFVQGNELTSLRCGHRFHTVCLYPWLQTCCECPNCRSCIVDIFK